MLLCWGLFQCIARCFVLLGLGFTGIARRVLENFTFQLREASVDYCSLHSRSWFGVWGLGFKVEGLKECEDQDGQSPRTP